jgi:hypothetical protein
LNYRFVILPILALIALVACEIEPAASTPVAAPDGIDALVAYASEHTITDAGALLDALPREIRENAVLLEASESPHRADAQHPRIVAFSPGARFLIAISSDPRDPRHDVVHMAELDHGAWRFRALDLASDSFVDDDRACVSCHGDPARPIWSSYPDWPGAFADETGLLNDGQRVALAAILADPTHRVAKLGLDLDVSTSTIQLADRFHAAPNAVLSAELGAAAAESLATRIFRSPRYRDHRASLLLVEECWSMDGVVEDAFDDLAEALDADPTKLRQALYETLGVDRADLDLERAAPDARDDAYWNAGGAYLHSLVTFLVLDDALADDRTLAELFAPIEPHRRRMIRDWWELDGPARRALFRAGSEVLLDPHEVFDAALGDAHDPRRRRFCEHLAATERR